MSKDTHKTTLSNQGGKVSILCTCGWDSKDTHQDKTYTTEQAKALAGLHKRVNS